MDLYICDKSINQLGIVDIYSSLRWRRKYYSPGEVEIHCPLTDENKVMMKRENIIRRKDRTEFAIINSVQIDNGNNEITVKGNMGSIILKNRVITPTVSFSSAAVEMAMQNIVYSNCILNRPISNLALGSLKGYTATCSFQATYKNVLEVLESLGKSANLGFRMHLDAENKKIIFDVYQGIDHSTAQSANPIVIFSEEFENLTSSQYTYNDTNYKNYAIVGGEGDESSRIIVEVDNTNGEDRRELWVDAKDLQKGSMTDDQYKAQLTQRGLEKLAESCVSETISGDIIDTANFQYLTDWDLGNIVTFKSNGITLSQRITEVEEVDENGVFTVTPVCGSPLPEILNIGG